MEHTDVSETATIRFPLNAGQLKKFYYNYIKLQLENIFKTETKLSHDHCHYCHYKYDIFAH